MLTDPTKAAGIITSLRALRVEVGAACAVHADTYAWLKAMPDGCVDVAILDPPYDEDTHANAKTNAGGGPGSLDIDFAALQSYDFVRDLLRVTRRWVIAFCALEQLGDYKRAAGGAWNKGGSYVRGGGWHRTNGTPQITGDRPAQGIEGIAILHSRHHGVRMRWNGGGHRAVYVAPVVRGMARPGRGIHRLHETQKPVAVIDQLVAQFTDRGELIFDGFGGSMTTGVSALKHERRFLGLEVREPAWREGAARLQRALRTRAPEDTDRDAIAVHATT